MKDGSFTKRAYRNPFDHLSDLRRLSRLKRASKTSRSPLSTTFRNRLMLAVTGVNNCRYCSFVHTRAALRSGIAKEEIGTYFEGELKGAPETEVPALLYAQHWAETDGRPEGDAHQKMVDLYGRGMTEAIEIALHSIRVGNLLGNTVDLVLFKLSFGRLGS